MCLSGRIFQYVEFQDSKIVIAEIRPAKVQVQFQNETIYTTKWINLSIWQELELLLNKIANKYQDGIEETSVNFVQGASVKLGYEIKRRDCKCSCLCPIDNQNYQQISALSLVVSVYPLHLKRNDVEFSFNPLKKYKTENIEQELVNLLRGYDSCTSRSSAAGDQKKLKKLKKRSLQNTKFSSVSRRSRMTSIFGTDSEGSLNSLKSDSLSRSIESGLSLEDAYLLTKRKDVQSMENKGQNHAIETTVTKAFQSNSSDEAVSKHHNLRNSSISPVLPTRHRKCSINSQQNTQLINEITALNTDKNATGRKSHEKNRTSRNSFSEFEVKGKSSKTKKAKLNIRNKYHESSSQQESSASHNNAEEAATSHNSISYSSDESVDSSFLWNLPCFEPRSSPQRNVQKEKRKRTKKEVKTLKTVSNGCLRSSSSRSCNSDLFVSSPTGGTCSSSSKETAVGADFLLLESKDTRQSMVCETVVRLSDRQERIPGTQLQSSQRLTKINKSVPIYSVSTLSDTDFSEVLLTSSSRKMAQSSRRKNTLKKKPREGSTKHGQRCEKEVGLSDSQAKKPVTQFNGQPSQCLNEEITTNSLPAQSTSTHSDSEEFSEVQRISFSRKMSQSHQKDVSKRIPKADLTEESFLRRVAEEFSRLTEDDMRIHLQENRSYLQDIIERKVYCHRDFIFDRGGNFARVFDADTFIMLFEDSFYDFLYRLLVKELGPVMENTGRELPAVVYSIAVLMPELLKKVFLTFPFVTEMGSLSEDEVEDVFLNLTMLLSREMSPI